MYVFPQLSEQPLNRFKWNIYTTILVYQRRFKLKYSARLVHVFTPITIRFLHGYVKEKSIYVCLHRMRSEKCRLVYCTVLVYINKWWNIKNNNWLVERILVRKLYSVSLSYEPAIIATLIFFNCLTRLIEYIQVSVTKFWDVGTHSLDKGI